MGRKQRRCCISKAPNHIRSINPAQYESLVFHIGPYHDRARVAAQEKKAQSLKEQWLNEVVQLSGSKRNEFHEEMMSLVKRVRDYYADEIDMDDEALAEMLLLDGCFVLVSLRGTERVKQLPQGSEGESESSYGHCCTHREESDEENQIALANNGIDTWDNYYIARDLFLLENQIPFFVVQKIYELLIQDYPYAERSAVSAVEGYIREVMAVYGKGTEAAPPPADQVHHLLHLCHMWLRPTFRQRSPWSDENYCSGGTVGRLLRATQYSGLMVRFKKLDIGGKAAPAGSILDVTFHDGVLEIPRLAINNSTWRQMANFILLEQGSPHLGLYATAYCAFMSQLAGTAEDVMLLCERGIIVHKLGSNADVADGFRKLCDGIIFDANDDMYNYLRPVYQLLEEHCRSRTVRLLCWLQGHANCPNPWMLLGILAIITLLCFILLQLQHATLRNPAT